MRHVAAVAALGLLASGCAVRPPPSRPPLLRPEARVEGGVAYVAGRLSAAPEAKGFEFGLLDAKGQAWVLPFDDANERFGLRRGQPALIAVPPGEYHVASWTSARMPKDQPLPANSALAQRFVLTPGQVVFLGAFTAGQVQNDPRPVPEGLGFVTQFSIQHVALASVDARRLLLEAYPGFASAPLRCLLCDTPPPRVAQRR